ncbi:MAG TPA: hypothetical protein V6D28_18910 [Leptolyngbyaceae cyanobacterium]
MVYLNPDSRVKLSDDDRDYTTVTAGKGYYFNLLCYPASLSLDSSS